MAVANSQVIIRHGAQKLQACVVLPCSHSNLVCFNGGIKTVPQNKVVVEADAHQHGVGDVLCHHTQHDGKGERPDQPARQRGDCAAAAASCACTGNQSMGLQVSYV